MSDGMRRVLDRAQLSDLLNKVLKDPVAVGRVVGYAESALLLQNDAGRPVFLLEAGEGIDSAAVTYLSQVFREVGVCAALLPKGAVSYIGEVDSISMEERAPQVDVPEPEPEPEREGDTGLLEWLRVRAALLWKRLRGAFS